jgi:hypothetical protein
MRKHEEMSSHTSCFNKANPTEMIFVLLARDESAPVAIEAWCNERVRLGKNKESDKQIVEARQCAQTMREERASIKEQCNGNP